MTSKNIANAKREDLVAAEIIESGNEIQPEVIEEEINLALKENLTDPKAIFNLYSKYMLENNTAGIDLLKEKSTEENFKKAVDRYDLVQSANQIKSKILSGEIDVLNLSDEESNILKRFKNIDHVEKLIYRYNANYDKIAYLYVENDGIKKELNDLGITHVGSGKTNKKPGITDGATHITKARRSEEKLFIRGMLEKAEYTENQITMATLEKFSDYSASAIEAVLRNSKNPTYTVYFADNEKTKPLTIKIDRQTKIATLS